MIRIQPRKRKAPDIGIAPLVDCVLLLLIFFLLTSSFSVTRAMKIDLPGSSTSETTEKDLITIRVGESGEITFEDRVMTAPELTEALQATVANDGKKQVLMVADRRVPLEKVTEVIDSVRGAKLETVSIATTRIPDGGRHDE